MISPALLGDLQLSWLPEIPEAAWYGIIASCAAIWLALRLWSGRSLVRRNWLFLILRGIALILVVVIALGPTLVDEIPGDTSRASIVYLFDGSQSMQLGNEQTRWQQCLDFRATAERKAGPENSSDTHAFRFGHRLMPLGGEERSTDPEEAATEVAAETNASATSLTSLTPVAGAIAPASADSIPLPDATDTRLADALRQLSQQVDSKSNAGVVLLSDGRVRAADRIARRPR